MKQLRLPARSRPRLLAALLGMGLAAWAAPAAAADAFVDAAKAKVASIAGAKTKWDGPTAGPKAAAARTIVFVAADMKNGGIVGVSKGVEEAGKAIGWTVRVIDGQGTVLAPKLALQDGPDQRKARLQGQCGKHAHVRCPPRQAWPDRAS